MLWWIFALVIVTILSYLVDVGYFPFLHDAKVPVVNGSIMSFLILLCTLGILGRMLYMSRKGQMENLQKKVEELEKELAALRAK